jgi:hypothetical protein
MSNARGLVIRNACAAALLVLGLLQIVGSLTGVRALRGIGACTAASPFPKVFSDVDGFETFAASFTIIYEVDGVETRERITPEFYKRLRGPYWRRNVYGAALSYGPRLPREIWETVFCYGLGADGPFHDEFEVSRDARRVRVLIETNTRGRADRWLLEPLCEDGPDAGSAS